jgi:hypothetical protein
MLGTKTGYISTVLGDKLERPTLEAYFKVWFSHIPIVEYLRFPLIFHEARY